MEVTWPTNKELPMDEGRMNEMKSPDASFIGG
jgi:hypothetical protein